METLGSVIQTGRTSRSEDIAYEVTKSEKTLFYYYTCTWIPSEKSGYYLRAMIARLELDTVSLLEPAVHTYRPFSPNNS